MDGYHRSSKSTFGPNKNTNTSIHISLQDRVCLCLANPNLLFAQARISLVVHPFRPFDKINLTTEAGITCHCHVHCFVFDRKPPGPFQSNVFLLNKVFPDFQNCQFTNM